MLGRDRHQCALGCRAVRCACLRAACSPSTGRGPLVNSFHAEVLEILSEEKYGSLGMCLVELTHRDEPNSCACGLNYIIIDGDCIVLQNVNIF